MKTIIVVEGRKGSGKTSAIRAAADILGCGLSRNSPADIYVVTHLKIGNNIYRVGIASAGDSGSIIKGNIDSFYPHHLDYVITACSAPRSMGLLQAFADLEGAQLVPISSNWQPNATAAQISSKVNALAQQIAGHVP